MILVYVIAVIVGLFILHVVISSAVQHGILDALDSIQRQRERQAVIEELEEEPTQFGFQPPEVVRVEDTVFAELEDLLSDLEHNAPKARKK